MAENRIWGPTERAQQTAIEVVLRNRQLAESRRQFDAQMAATHAERNQKDQQEFMKIVDAAQKAKIDYAKDMMKTAYEKGDTTGMQTFGAPLQEQGFPVPGQALPQKQGMSEAELTERALSGDKLAQSILERMARRKIEAARAGAGTTTVNNQIGDKSMTELGKEMSKDLVSERKDVQGAVSSLENMKEAESLLNSGMITGTGAEFLTNTGNLLASRLGYKAFEDPVANTQAFAATMGQQVGQIIKQFGSGTGLSDADREYAEKIVGGKITLNEQAIRKLLAINKKAYKNVIKRFNQKAEQAMQRPGAEQLPYDLRIDYKLDDEGQGQKETSAATGRFKILKVKKKDQ